MLQGFAFQHLAMGETPRSIEDQTVMQEPPRN